MQATDHPELCGAERGHVAAGTAAENHQIVGMLCHNLTFPGGRRGGCRNEENRCSDLQQHARRLFDDLFDPPQEGHRLAAVHDPMIVGQRDVHHRADHHLALVGDGPLLDGVQAQYAALRGIDDRRRQQRSVDAAVGDRKGAACQFFRADFVRFGALGEVGDLVRFPRNSSARHCAAPGPPARGRCRWRFRCRSSCGTRSPAPDLGVQRREFLQGFDRRPW
jgi:hypothetical protein